ncbi:MAG: hypothetical protein ACODAJ_13450, partial [Planctomycetota bacterium]
PDVVPLLAEAVASEDAAVATRAREALKGLVSQGAVDALCACWAQSRDERLGALVAERGYVAAQPGEVRVLTALKCGKRTKPGGKNAARVMLGLLGDPDEVVRSGAERGLRHAAPGLGQDALCDEAIRNPGGPAARICIEEGMRHSDHERNCLFLFVTRQLDAYFEEDFEFQALRLEYDRADAAVQGHVMEVVRSGDRRCAGFFGTKSKPLAECSETEIKLALDSWVRHEQWDRLFQACLEMPLKYGLSALEALRGSGWQPDAPELRSVFRQVLADGQGQSVPPPQEPKSESSLFERWLAEGQSDELAGASEADLVKRLEGAEPPAAVPIVAALAAKARPGSPAAKKVQESPHWLARLAGHATGLTMDLAHDSVEDTNYWVKELATASSVLEFWPGTATPADLEALSAAPAEAWTGRLGGARKVLRTLMGHRITTGVFEPIVVEAHELAGVFVEADEAELADGGDAS